MKERKGFFVWLILFLFMGFISIIGILLDKNSTIAIFTNILRLLLFVIVFFFAAVNISYEKISFFGFIIGVFIFEALLFLVFRILMMIGYANEIITSITFVLSFSIFISLGVFHAWKLEPQKI